MFHDKFKIIHNDINGMVVVVESTERKIMRYAYEDLANRDNGVAYFNADVVWEKFLCE